MPYLMFSYLIEGVSCLIKIFLVCQRVSEKFSYFQVRLELSKLVR